MTFHNTRFPDSLSYGSSFGPTYDTGVVVLDSGHEVRDQRRSQPQRRFELLKAIQDPDKIALALNFFHARGGNSVSFRVKDWSDYTTAANHRAAPAFDDQVIGTGDGTTTTFQLKKKYSDAAGFFREANILLPVVGTTLLGINSVEQTSGFTVNDTTGEVQITPAPTAGHEITAGCEFDIMARFDYPTPERMPIEIDSFGSSSIRSMPMLEVLDEAPVTLERYAGGAKRHSLLTADVSITVAQGLVHAFNPTVSGLEIILPNAADLPAGGHPWFVLFNEGPNTMDVVTTAATIVIDDLGANEIGQLFISVDVLGNKVWIGTATAGG